MTYGPNLAPDETRRDISLSTATDATPRNLGTMTGYGVFYEGNAPSHDAATRTNNAPIWHFTSITNTPVGQVFDSFEIVAHQK